MVTVVIKLLQMCTILSNVIQHDLMKRGYCIKCILLYCRLSGVVDLGLYDNMMEKYGERDLSRKWGELTNFPESNMCAPHINYLGIITIVIIIITIIIIIIVVIVITKLGCYGAVGCKNKSLLRCHYM